MKNTNWRDVAELVGIVSWMGASKLTYHPIPDAGTPKMWIEFPIRLVFVGDSLESNWTSWNAGREDHKMVFKLRREGS